MENDTRIERKETSLIRQVAESVGITEQDASKVLSFMGLENVLKEVDKIGVNIESINSNNLKVAVRLSKNTIPV